MKGVTMLLPKKQVVEPKKNESKEVYFGTYISPKMQKAIAEHVGLVTFSAHNQVFYAFVRKYMELDPAFAELFAKVTEEEKEEKEEKAETAEKAETEEEKGVLIYI
jgi:hypothetical protein